MLATEGSTADAGSHGRLPDRLSGPEPVQVVNALAFSGSMMTLLWTGGPPGMCADRARVLLCSAAREIGGMKNQSCKSASEQGTGRLLMVMTQLIASGAPADIELATTQDGKI